MIGKKLVPCIFIHQGKAVKWFDNFEVISEDVVSLAKNYDLNGADELLVFDLSQNDEEHDMAIDTLKKVAREVHIPITAGGNIKRQEDVKKILYAGAQKAMVNLSKAGSIELVEEVSKRFGKEKIVVSTYKMLWDHIEIVNKYASAIVAMSIEEVKEIANDIILPVYALQSCCEESDISEVLNNELISGIIGGSLNNTEFDFLACKEFCYSQGICMNALECNVAFKEFKLNSDGLIPVIVQDFRTNEVLMMAYMNEEAYVKTLLCGKMTYYSRSRNSLWLKGETSGHYQYVKSLTVDCDKDTILAKVDQIGVACHTGASTCFFTPLVEDKVEELNPLKVFESVYDTIMDRKLHPKEGSYTNYLFDKGIDKILKKVGEEATELVIAAKNPNPEEIKYELSDFLYHAMVLMVERGVSWDDIVKELADR